MKFGNIILDRKGRCTVGDDIQLLAIENLYNYMNIPYEDVVRIPFSQLSTYDGEYVILPLSFPFYGYSNANNITNFSPKIIPVFLGFATMANTYNTADISYLKKYEPIGCRDQYTMNAVRNSGVKAYLNGCLTATLPKVRYGADARKKIFCVDVSPLLQSYIPKEMLPDCEFVNHVVFSDDCPNGTEEKAKEMYSRYVKEAKLIITTRMHAALPCIAMGIPVILAKDNYSMRFPIIEKFIPVYTKETYGNIDWNPQSVNYEEFKIKVLESAKKRLNDTFAKYEDLIEISEFYETSEDVPEYLDNFSGTIHYLKSNYNPTDSFEYVLWGITQTAELAHSYIEKNYPNAKLIGVIDQFRKMDIYGVTSGKREFIEEHPDSICFICAGAIMPMAKEYFKEIDYKNAVYCWSDGLPE